MDKKTTLSLPTILLHWVTGLLFLAIFCIGFSFDFMEKGSAKGEWMGIHKSLGAILLVIALIRLIWRIKEGSISSISPQKTWQDKLAKGLHHLLLLFTILMPVSGIVMSIGGGRGLNVFGLEIIAAGEKIPALGAIGSSIHNFCVIFIIIAVLIHVAAALKHQWIEKDGTLSRMLGKKM